MRVTYLIVPAVTDRATQCRVVAKQHEDLPGPGLADYRRDPDSWREAGIVNARGELVCLDCTHPSHSHSMKRDQPLYPPTTYTFVEDTDAEPLPRSF
jgi:hypothetical protein